MSKIISSEAHGRVNLIGEHTDYNAGFVLPALIPQKTKITGQATNDDKKVRIHSLSLNQTKEFFIGQETPVGNWVDYIQGLTLVLTSQGANIPGFTAQIQSNVPLGSGLSSSAALCVAMLRFIRESCSLKISDQKIPELCQKVENEFVGAKVGIMDPAVCAWAIPGHALFIDTKSLESRNVPLPKDAKLLVINSGISHRNIGGGYSERRQQCEESAKILGLQFLREIEVSDLAFAQKKLSSLQFRRTRHVVTENARVLACVQALEKNDLHEVGQLFSQSHASMRDDYEVSIPEIDFLVQVAEQQSGVYGARLTGGGFGGSIVALCKAEMATTAATQIQKEYQKQFGIHAQILVPQNQGDFL